MACCIRNCGNSKKKTPDVTFHRFPLNEERRNMWIRVIERPDWMPGKSSVICSAHFNEDDFDRTSPLAVRLKKHALPRIHEKVSNNVPLEITCENPEVLQADSNQSNLQKVVVSQNLPSSTDTSSDLMKCALATIENVTLRRKLNNCLEKNNQYRKKIRTMEEVIKQQQKKINNLTTLLRELSEDEIIDCIEVKEEDEDEE